MSIEDLKMMQEYGVDAVLIGELFMRNIDNPDFKAKFKEFKNQ